MKLVLGLLLATLMLEMVVEAVSNIETKPLLATKPKRYKLGSMIRSDEHEGVLVERVTTGNVNTSVVTDTVVDMKISIGFNPMMFRRTFMTIPIPSERRQGDDFRDLVRNDGCVLVRFLAMEDLSNKDEIPEDAVVIISNELVSDKMTSEVRKNLREKRVTLAFLKRFKPIEDACRKMFVDDRIAFIENLDLPNEIDLMSVVKSKKQFFGFWLIFSPFKNSTIIYREANVEQKALVNLVDLVLFEGDDRLAKFCKENKANVMDFSQKLGSENFPILAGVDRPLFIERQVGTNETRSQHLFQFSGLTGTSIVAPRRFANKGFDITNLTTDFFFSPCVCIEMPAGDKSNFKVTKGHLEQWEKDKAIRIPNHSTILLNTGWSSKWDKEPAEYIKNYPGVEVDALRWLVENRSAVAVGIDSLAIDDFSNLKNQLGLGYLAEKNLPALLNLRFGDKKFPEAGSRCAFSYLRIQDGTVAPLALFGLPGYDSMELGSKKLITENIKENVKVVAEKIESKLPVVVEKQAVLSGSSERWQLGRMIRHQADNCDCNLRQVSMDIFKGYGENKEEKHRMSFTETSLSVDPAINRVTTLTQPGDQPIFSTKGCIETLFIKTTELISIRKKLLEVKDGMLVLFLATDLVKLHDIELIKEASAKKVQLGFFDDVELTSDIRNRLIENNLTFFENLARRSVGFDMAKIDERRVYYAFEFIFSPFKEGTSLGTSVNMKPVRKVNLADLVIFDTNVNEINERCLKKRLFQLNREWSPADKIPIVGNISRPSLGEDGRTMVFFDHFGTHIDAPSHLGGSKAPFDMSQLPDTLDRPVCLKIEIPYEGKQSFSISKQNLVDWEAKAGMKIPERSMVVLVTGFGSHSWNRPEEYQVGYAGLSLEGAQFLVEERKVVAIGIDSLMIDDYATTQFLTRYPTHWYLASKGVVIVENLGGEGLDRLTSDSSAICTMSYLRIEKAGGSPSAVFALLGAQARVEPSVTVATVKTTVTESVTTDKPSATSTVTMTATTTAAAEPKKATAASISQSSSICNLLSLVALVAILLQF